MLLYTIGHSTRSGEEFVQLLKAFDIRVLADIRRIPRSRRHPQFGAEALADLLAQADILYVHLIGLGGRRKPRPDSTHTEYRNQAFRGYADYMDTPEFERALYDLLSLDQGPVAVMCAEALPWKCHRWLLSDALVARGIQVRHILSSGAAQDHSAAAPAT